MPRPRLTLRSLMLAVAVLCLAVGAFREGGRFMHLSGEYRLRAITFARRGEPFRRNSALTHTEWEARVIAIHEANKGAWFKTGAGPSPEQSRKFWPYYQSLRRKYEQAARYPWLPVAPDPPLPE